MKNTIFSTSKTSIVGLALAGLTALSAAAADTPKRVLVVTVTTGFRHSSIPTAEKVIAKLGQDTGLFTVEFAQQPPNQPAGPRRPAALKADADDAAKEKYRAEMAKFEKDDAAYRAAAKEWDAAVKLNLEKLGPEALKKYDAVIFANTTGDLPVPDREAFLQWVREGHGFVGMHSASDTFHGFKPYLEMLGGEFQTHREQVEVDAINQDNQCAACKHLAATWKVFDEIYILKNFERANVHGLLTLDKHPNDKTPGDYPLSWKKEYGKGRVFYTSLGHREDVWDDDTPPNFKRRNSVEVARQYQQHILGGIKWTLGLENCDAKPQSK